jgi:hypothetical protein
MDAEKQLLMYHWKQLKNDNLGEKRNAAILQTKNNICAS